MLKPFQHVNFMCGFLIGIFFIITIHNFLRNSRTNLAIPKPLLRHTHRAVSHELYEHNLSDKLYDEIRILCYVFTHADNHKTKMRHIKNTWGRRCNKLLIMSTKLDPEFPEIVVLPVENGRSHLWFKARLALKYVFDNHLNDADWFLRADDDNYFVMENIRYTLYKYRTTTSLHMGHRYVVNYKNTVDGYMAGGGQLFSKKAVIKFGTKLFPNPLLCDARDGEAEDMLIGRCLGKFAIFIDARDEKNQKQMFPVGVEEHVKNDTNPNYWYQKNLWHNVSKGGLDCCSDVFMGMHYVPPNEMYFLEYLVYHVHPFGIQKNLTEVLPRKLSLQEIMKASDVKSYSPNFIEHKIIHNLDQDEKFRK